MNNEMNWEDLRYFLELAHQGTLQAAADRLGVSHTSVYQRIRALQDQLGTRLFERDSNRYALTAVGGQLLRKLEGVEHSLDELTRELLGLDQRISGRLVIATTDTLGFALLPPILRDFRRAYPEVEVHMKTSGHTVNLAQREADIVIRTALTSPDALIGHKLGSIRFGLYRSRNNLADSASRADDSEGLWTEGAVILNSNDGFLASSSRLREEAGDAPMIETDSLLLTAELCRQGMGAAVLPLYMGLRFKDLVLIRRLKEPRRHAWLLYHSDLMSSPRVNVAAKFFTLALKDVLLRSGAPEPD